MDIVTHVLSGIAVGTVAASVSGKDISGKGYILLCGAVGAALPDVDALTRWSGFDNTLGRWLNLGERGRDIYFAGHWYSHHNATHSILAGITAAAALLGFAYFIHRLSAKKKAPWPGFVKEKAPYAAALFLGYMAHLAGDLPTPSSTWGGIRLFWPLGVMVGGWGRIWWWNNYDIFLLIYLCCMVNVVLLLALRPRGKNMKVLPAIVLAVTLAAVAYQIKTRPASSASGDRSHRSMEAYSLKLQRDMLGGAVYGSMKSLDDALARMGIIL